MGKLLWTTFLSAALAWLVVLAAKFLLRLIRHPLRVYPGPKLSALTVWYKAYYQVWKGGALVEQLEKLHGIYGPVVRIAPNELHFSDPLAYADIYAPGSKFTKEPIMYAAFGEDESSFGYVDPVLAKTRRSVLNPLFSRRAVLKFESVIQEKADKLVSRIVSRNGKPVNMTRAFRSTTIDIITSYCFAQCPETLEAPEFDHPLTIIIETAPLMTWMFTYFPFIRYALSNGPDWFVCLLNPESKAVADLRKAMSAQIDRVLEHPEWLDHADREIVYHHLMTPQPNHPVPSRRSLEDEAQNLFFAGADTVGNACALGAFYVCNDTRVLGKLLKELDDAWPDKDIVLGYETLEKLPYLAAVIKESLRMSHGVVNGTVRVVGPTDAVIAGRHVPVGTEVSIGSTFIHWNPDIFPEPRTFKPERWLQSNSRELESYMVAFSRGPRSCLGINLANSELCLIFANIFRKLDVRPHKTTVEDFNMKAYFLPHYQGQFYAHAQERSV